MEYTKEGLHQEEALRRDQKKSMVWQSLLCLIYLLVGVLLFTTGDHCFVDAPLYWTGGLLAAGCAVLYSLYETRLSDYLDREAHFRRLEETQGKE